MNFDFNIVKKAPILKKPQPKKIVAPSDILLPKKLTLRATNSTNNSSHTHPINKQPYNKQSMLTVFGKSVPSIAIMCLIALVLQSFAYLSQAKNSSGLVLGSATTAYDNLDLANKSLNEMDFGGAKQQFNSAQTSLETAQNELNKFWILTALAPQAKGADNVLKGASFLAEAGKNLTRALQLFDEIQVTSGGITTDNFTSKLTDNYNLLKNSRLLLSYAQENFNKASGLPDAYAQTLTHAKDQINILSNVLDNLISLEDLFLSFFGSEPKTYLLVFQNYDEMRATGGFIGTYGVLKYQNGIINQLKIESVYNIDGSLTKLIAAPGPFQPEIKKWALRDSNWFADFPTSANKMLEFFEMESQTADGVIALTPNIFEDVLKLVGNIRMDQYNVVLTPDNFQEIVQNETSYDFDKELNQPKKFLDDFAPVLLNRLTSLGQEEWFTMFQIIKNNFMQKHVLMFSADPVTQEKIVALNFDGSILEAPHDYLAVINSNHGGTKTDLEIDQTISVVSNINQDGTISNTATIKRFNNSTSDSNGNFMRVLIPLDSRVKNVDGFINKDQLRSEQDGYNTDALLKEWDNGYAINNSMIRTESGKTSVTGWLNTTPQTQTEIVIEYDLPIRVSTSFFKHAQAHSFLFQKQPGVKQSPIVYEIHTPKGNSTFNSTGQTDVLWPIVIKK